MFDFFTRPSKASTLLSKVERTREKLARLSDEELKQQGRRAVSLAEVVAATAVVSARVLGLAMFDVQVRAAVALAEGHVVEMATGEGKTLAAVPAIAWYARAGEGVHVLTANDYLAGRDAEWMRVVYDWMGLSVASVHQDDDRRRTEGGVPRGRDVCHGHRSWLRLPSRRSGAAHRPSWCTVRLHRRSSTKSTRSSSTKRAFRS